MSVMLSFHAASAQQPTLRDAADHLKVRVDQLDASYGVRVIDPWNHVYVVRSMGSELGKQKGAHSDPKIGVFG